MPLGNREKETLFFICHVTTCDRAINGSLDFIDRSSSVTLSALENLMVLKSERK